MPHQEINDIKVVADLEEFQGFHENLLLKFLSILVTLNTLCQSIQL